jgi:hypothetical protein
MLLTSYSIKITIGNKEILMTKKFAILQAAMSPAAQSRSAAKAKAMLLKLQLQALLKAAKQSNNCL